MKLLDRNRPSLWSSGIGVHLGRKQDASLSPGSVGYILCPMFIEATFTRVPSWFSGYRSLGFLQGSLGTFGLLQKLY